MSSSGLKQALLFIFLVLLQVLVLNHIFFLGYATPYLYLYFLIKLPVGANRNWVVFLGFLLGTVIDLFCNTLGINAAAATLVAFLREPIQKLFFERDAFEGIEPRFSNLGGSFIKYVIIMILVHHAALISIESFSYYNVGTVLLKIGLSSILTFILIYALEILSSKKVK